MEKNYKMTYAISDPATLKVLGDFIRKVRLQQNKTQQAVAAAAGVNRSTIVQIENGNGGTLLTFIQILRALEQLHLIKNFELVNQISPLELAEIEQKKRKRASKQAPLNKSKTAW